MDVIGFLSVSPGSSTIQLHDSLGSRYACACSEAGFNSQNGDHPRGVHYWRALLCCVFFCGQKDSMQRISINKYFLFMLRSACRIKQLHVVSKCFAHDEEVETEVQKWPRQQSKDIYAVGFDAMGQVYQCWWRICWEINVFPRFEYHTFYISYPFVTCLLTPTYIHTWF
jgi:hypothetical protein